jgi:polyisoprenoid-binding protein YceI
MLARTIVFLLVVAGAARAEKAWVFEPGQALVAIEAGPRNARVSAVSLGLSGSLRELEDGAVRADVRLSLASFTSNGAPRDLRARHGSDAARHPEIVFEGSADAPRDGKLHLHGTLTLLGETRPLDLTLSLVRAGGGQYAHGAFAIHLREFGLALPPGADEVRVELDAGMRPEGALASR